MASLFDPQPKSDPKYLYGRDKELSDLVSRVRSNDWVILMGPRRVGKTSLARCAATRLKLKTVVIDARIESDIVKGLANSLEDRNALNVQGSATIPKTPIGVSASYTKTSLGQTVDQLLSKVKRLLVIVDEAQWLRNPRSVTC